MRLDVAQEKLGEPAQPHFHVQCFQNRLAILRTRQHSTRNQICGLFRVGNGIKITDDFLG